MSDDAAVLEAIADVLTTPTTPTTYTYVLELTNGKYYIGTTDNIVDCIAAHSSGEYTPWTSIHRTVGTEDIFTGTIIDSTALTLQYMEQYGIDNVRSDYYNDVQLSDMMIRDIQLITNAVTDVQLQPLNVITPQDTRRIETCTLVITVGVFLVLSAGSFAIFLVSMIRG